MFCSLSTAHVMLNTCMQCPCCPTLSSSLKAVHACNHELIQETCIAVSLSDSVHVPLSMTFCFMHACLLTYLRGMHGIRACPAMQTRILACLEGNSAVAWSIVPLYGFYSCCYVLNHALAKDTTRRHKKLFGIFLHSPASKH